MLRPLALALVLASGLAFAGPDTEAFGPGQAIADELRAATGAEIGWVPAGILKDAGSGDLASYVLFLTDEIAVVKLTGAQVRAALERAVSLYPTPNPSFLQVSGIEVSFSKSAEADKRIRTVLVNGIELNPATTYDVAMPANLAKGGLGYFTVWDKKSISRVLPEKTLESLLKGKTGFVRTSRWKAIS